MAEEFATLESQHVVLALLLNIALHMEWVRLIQLKQSEW
jgi:hypothetical protein